MTEHPLDILKGHNFISLTTFRKSGVAVSTPVWFTVIGEKFYVFTDPTSGKVKRIRNNNQVKVAPSDAKGKVLGESFDAQARLLTPEEFGAPETAFRKKYGFQWKIFGLMARSGQVKPVFLELTP